MASKQEKIRFLLQKTASEFFARESNRSSLLTVTRVEMRDRDREAAIFFSIFPDSKEEQAFDFIRRKRSEFYEYLKEKTKLQYLPRIDFAIDEGEKNRRRIDELSREK